MSTLTTPVPLTEPELKLLQTLVYQECGMYFDERRTHFLRDRLQRRLKTCQMDSFYSYYRLLTSREGKQELVALLENLTVNETSFFRIRPQLELFQKYVLETILKRKQERRDFTLRIWSAGCSTGEEPYTLRMLLLEEANGLLRDWSVEILATDLNERSLAHAKEAVYGNYSTRNLTPAYRNRYFLPRGDHLQVNPLARSNISFSRLNLSEDSRMMFMKSMDAIFCCNVLIYFDLASKRRVIQHFFNNLLPHGYLFLGHSESLYGVTEDFRLVHLPGTTAYVKGERTPGGKTL